MRSLYALPTDSSLDNCHLTFSNRKDGFKSRKPHIAFSFPQKPNVKGRSANHDSDFKAGKLDQSRTNNRGTVMKTLVIIALIVLISDVAAYGTPPNYQIGLTYPSGYVVYDDHDNQVRTLGRVRRRGCFSCPNQPMGSKRKRSWLQRELEAEE
ncbi:uncharacterized protein LOC110055333 [Orbicella faveolata]|uniref:uncharacterized protein LOC110055333 n=1 Tax=Orbicella faveolata TaxID=48498 RepID=UPI0009E23841|nr:uncharacterized protein LOC110055333 [Orbicella faveolata]